MRTWSRIFLLVVAFVPALLHAQTPPPVAHPEQSTMLDPVTEAFRTAAGGIETTVRTFAQRLFYLLVIIDFVWALLEVMLKQGEAQSVLALLVRRIMFYGFFNFVLLNSHDVALAIVNSFQAIGGASVAAAPWASPTAALPIPTNGGLQPSVIAANGVNVAFAIVDHAPTGLLYLCDAVLYGVASVLAIVIFLAFSAREILVLCEFYILQAGGVILLGFGSARWTNEYAKNYLKWCVAIGMKLMFIQISIAAMLSIVGQYLASGLAYTEPGIIGLIMLLGILALITWNIPSAASALVQGVGGHGGGMGTYMVMQSAARALTGAAGQLVEAAKKLGAGNKSPTASQEMADVGQRMQQLGQRMSQMGGGGGGGSAKSGGFANGLKSPPGASP